MKRRTSWWCYYPKKLRGMKDFTFCGVLSEKDILTLPQLARTLSKETANCLARSTPYRQFPKSIVDISQYPQIFSHTEHPSSLGLNDISNNKIHNRNYLLVLQG
ncbi:hypothetical protein V8G54_024695 [Vigna mungo]|uniref:Uncharacterized protein n=1 Tax=Vigna mungo TaxID=3915 RepID=A0AAQ3RTE6_VIGMU